MDNARTSRAAEAPAVDVDAPPAGEGTVADLYARAACMLDANLAGAIRNVIVSPHWIEGGRRFWYRRETANSPEWLVVDAASGSRRLAFDPVRLRYALADRLPPEAPLPVVAIEPAGTEFEIVLRLKDRSVRCPTADYRCFDEDTPQLAPDTLWPKSGSFGVLARDHNLLLRSRETGAETPLTEDGQAHYAYGVRPGTSLFAVPDMRATRPAPPFGLFWSPDGAHLFGIRTDERLVEPYPFVEWVPKDGGYRPKLWEPRIPLLGDAEQGRHQPFVIDVERRRKAIVALPEGWNFQVPVLSWSTDGRFVYGLAATRGNKRTALVETELATGSVRLVVENRAATMETFNVFIYSPPNVRVLDASGEVLWFSQEDGWGQIYLHDLATGDRKRQLTSGARAVRDIVGVDETRRWLYFTAGGTDEDTDPYHVRLYAVPLDGGDEICLTPEAAVHVVALTPIAGDVEAANRAGLSPDGNWIVESYSTLEAPPVTMLRAAEDGRVISVLEEADAARVFEAGWTAPTRVKLLAADGRTPLWGTVYFPHGHEPGRQYPVIDAVYGGPQVINAPADFPNAVQTMNPISRASLAQLGFVVVTIDGRGTPGRSKAFNDESYGGSFAEPELADHAAGLRQLAERFGCLDLDRVGTYGHSFGGYVSTRAILTHPDLYKVAVSSAGPHNFHGFYPVENFFDVPDYGDGARNRPDPNAVPAPYDQLDSGPYAKNLRGKLMLVYGDLDENALPAVTLQLIDALIRANKRYDLLYLPNRDHNFFRTDAYYTLRMWDYFVEHLLGVAPPDDFQLELKPLADASGY
jgi:dipeptidyl-peptidase-4